MTTLKDHLLAVVEFATGEPVSKDLLKLLKAAEKDKMPDTVIAMMVGMFLRGFIDAGDK